MGEKFKVGDRVTCGRFSEYGVGTVVSGKGTHLAPAGQVFVRFDDYDWYANAADYHTPLVADLDRVGRTPVSDFRTEVQAVLKEIEDILVEKNESYGNAALKPLKVFSQLDASERLKVRLDDKLNRLYNGGEYGQEDTEFDLLGYLVLKRIEDKGNGNE